MSSWPVPGPHCCDRVRYRIGPFWYRYPRPAHGYQNGSLLSRRPPECNSRPQLASRASCSESPGSHHDFPYRTTTVHRYAYQIGSVPVRHNLSTKEVTR